VQNQPQLAAHHFCGLKEAKPNLRGMAVFDRLPMGLPQNFAIRSVVWTRREIENYLCTRNVLLRYAGGSGPDDLVSRAEGSLRSEAMTAAIGEVEHAFRVLNRDPWSKDEKVSDELLPSLFFQLL
jgi:hypothetical protein